VGDFFLELGDGLCKLGDLLEELERVLNGGGFLCQKNVVVVGEG
jgi:hypothetical protein